MARHVHPLLPPGTEVTDSLRLITCHQQKRQIPWEGRTDGDEQFLRPPDPRENIDQTLLAPHIPSPLLLPTTIAIE